MTKLELLEKLEGAKNILLNAGTQEELQKGLKKATKAISGVWGKVPAINEFLLTLRAMDDLVLTLNRRNYEGRPEHLRADLRKARESIVGELERLYKIVVDLDMEEAPALKKVSIGHSQRGILLADEVVDPKKLASDFINSEFSKRLVTEGRLAIRLWVEDAYPEVGLNSQICNATTRIAGVIIASLGTTK